MKREAKIGLFAVTMILLAWAGIRFLSGLDVFSRNAEYIAAYDQVNGVQEASAVMMKGVKIGSVSRIELNPENRDKVLIYLTVRRSYRIPTDSEARIFSDGFLGGKAVEIVNGKASTYLESGDTLRSSHDRDLMDVAGSELEFFKQKFAEVAASLERTLGNLNGIMERNADNLASTLQHVESLTGDVAALLHEEKQNLSRAVEGLSEFSTMLGENAERVDSLIAGVNGVVGQLEEDAFAEKLTATLDRLNGLLAQIERGEGTIGALMKDGEMYANLTEASENLAALLADFKERPARYVHLSVFGKDADKQALKAEKRAAKAAEKAEKEAQKAAKKATKQAQ
ncbi:MAG: MCE family protein [Alistipes sp.]|nr:MCE family protein [Alistipes sp.]